MNPGMITKEAKGSKRSALIFCSLLLTLALIMLLAGLVFAAEGDPGVSWWVFSGGGGSVGGGNVTLDSTLGQPVAGASYGGSLSLGAGYWYEEQPVQVFLPQVQR
jgi:hypothetical protein